MLAALAITVISRTAATTMTDSQAGTDAAHAHPVVAQCLQQELGADERAYHGQAPVQVDDPVQHPGKQHVHLPHVPDSANALQATISQALVVMPNRAGIELKANSRSASPIARASSSTGRLAVAAGPPA